MPRPRPRRDPCDCRDCLDGDGDAASSGAEFLVGIAAADDEKTEPSSSKTSTCSSPPLTGTRAARQDPPPRALLLLCDDMLPALIEEAAESSSDSRSSMSSFPHLDAVARGGAVGALALRKEEAEAEEENDDPRLRRHAALFQLLGMHSKKKKESKPRSLSDRFLGLSAALVTTAASAAAAVESSSGGLDRVEQFLPVGASRPPPPPPEAAAPPSSSSSSAALLASRVSQLLGIDKSMQLHHASAREGEEGNDDGSFDLVLVHLTADAFAATETDASSQQRSAAALSYADSFLRHVRSAPGALDDQGDDALLVVVVFSSNGGGEEEGGGRLALPPRGGAPLSCCSSTSFSSSVHRPAQSFEFAEGVKLETSNEALLVASRCDGVLRVDGSRRLLECRGRRKSEKSKQKSDVNGGGENGGGDNGGFTVSPGGNGLGCMLAEHLLDEVAYKIGRALKYGA